MDTNLLDQRESEKYEMDFNDDIKVNLNENKDSNSQETPNEEKKIMLEVDPKTVDISLEEYQKYYNFVETKSGKTLSKKEKQYITASMKNKQDPISNIILDLVSVVVPFVMMSICWTFSSIVDYHYCKYFTNSSYETSFGLAGIIQDSSGLIIPEIVGGTETMLSQSFGQKNYKRMTALILNCLIIMLYTLPFLGPLYFFSGSWSVYLFSDQEVAANIQVFCRYSLLFLPIYFILRSIAGYQLAAQIYLPLNVSSIESIILYPFYSYYIVFGLSMQFIGLAISWTISFYVQFALYIGTSLFVKEFMEIFTLSWDVIKDSHRMELFKENLKYGLPAFALVFLNSFNLSKSQFIVFWTVKPQFTDMEEYEQTFNAHLALQNIMFVFWLLGGSVAGAISYPVGNKMGEGCYLNSRKFSKIAIYSCVTSGFILACIMQVFGKQISILYAKDQLTLDVMAECIPFAALTVMVYYVYCGQLGVYYGIGYQQKLLIVSIFSNYVLGIPMDIVFSYYYGIKGIWMSLFASYFIRTCILTGIFAKINWKSESYYAVYNNKKEGVEDQEFEIRKEGVESKDASNSEKQNE